MKIFLSAGPCVLVVFFTYFCIWVAFLIRCLWSMLAPVLQMFQSPTALWGSSTELQLKELLQSPHQGHEGCSGYWSPAHQQLPVRGGLPGSSGGHHSPTGPLSGTDHRCHRRPLVRQQQTCHSITGGLMRWLMSGYEHEMPNKEVIQIWELSCFQAWRAAACRNRWI